MDDLYQAKLTGEPPHPQVHIGEQSSNNDPAHHAERTHHQRSAAQPIPIQLPNIYVHPYPPAQPQTPLAPTAPVTINLEKPTATTPTVTAVEPDMAPASILQGQDRGRKIGPIRLRKPHPLLWLSLILSITALVLQVPKGSLPTLTGRHKALRTQERLVQEKLHLLNKLSAFLPPPLSALISPLDPHNPIPSSLHALNNQQQQLDFLRLAPQLKFWNTAVAYGEEGEKWWSVEELGEGASVVRSKGEGHEREVWVLRMGDGGNDDTHTALTSALTHSLLLRDRLQSEITHLKAIPCPTCPAASPSTPQGQYYLDRSSSKNSHSVRHARDDEEYPNVLEDEWEKLDERKAREKARERDVEERETEVARREQWVVEEMRKLSDKVQ
nr:uncharacterized protein CI109_001083 [Kwoniella shandongensis]KAA5530283.1 hypothetical protein CI109_001083 [Kwoniella shandongensis]